jgi:hypothetical protein
MRPVAAAVTAAVAVCLSATAAAAPSTTIRLSIGDAVEVVGTKIACFAITSNGKDGIGCVLLKGSKPITGTFGVGLAFDGTAVVSKVKPDGTAQRIFKRRLQGIATARSATYRVRVGDLFGMPIDSKINLGCRVINVTDTSFEPLYRGVKVSCWRATTTAAVPRSYGVSISDKFAGVFAFQANGKLASNGFVRRQPR